jgi:hypothetical protein
MAQDPDTKIYSPLRHCDSAALNANVTASDASNSNTYMKPMVPLEFTRSTADLTNLVVRCNFWNEAPRKLAYSTWFFNNPADKKSTPQPLTPEDASVCEGIYNKFLSRAAAPVPAESLDALLSGRYHDKQYKVTLVRDEQPTRPPKPNGPTATWPPEPPVPQHYCRLKLKAVGLTNVLSPLLNLTRGHPPYASPGEHEETQLSPIAASVVFVIHGIGEHFFAKKENTFAPSLIEQVNAARIDIHKRQLAQHERLKASNPSAPPPGRIEILPIVWSDVWHTGTTTKTTLERCTIPSIGVIRTVANDIIFDVLQYQQSSLRNKTLKYCSESINEIYQGYSGMNPGFVEGGGSMSIIGHSLGSVITWDLVSLMSETIDAGEHDDKSFLPESSALVGPPLPKVCANVFLVGSPVGLFLTLRGAQIALSKPGFRLRGGERVYNIYHPSDPVAYRIEPLLTTGETADASFVPAADGTFASANGVRFHLQSAKSIKTAKKDLNKTLKTATKSIMGFSKGAMSFMDTVSAAMAGEALSEKERAMSVDSEEEEQESYALGGGARVDYQMQTGLVENELLAALTAHTGYFNNEDFMSFVVRTVGERQQEQQQALEAPMAVAVNVATRVFDQGALALD